MTLHEAKNLLALGDLAGVYNYKPAGASLKQIFLDCISCSQGAELDAILENCLGLKRHAPLPFQNWLYPGETDVDFRNRAELHAYVLDKFVPPSLLGSAADEPAVCYHSWKSYQGLMEKYDYCEFCDTKRFK